MISFESPEEQQSKTELKNAHSMLKIRGMVDGIKKVICYIIPSCKEDLFLEHPELINTSVDAKAFYQVSAELYQENTEIHDAEIIQRFESLTEVMGVISEFD